MKNLFAAILVGALTLTLGMPTDAEARRMGGGGSFGKQSQTFKRQANTPPASNQAAPAKPAAPAAAPGAAAPKPASPWKGMLGGALLGLGLGALLSHLGIGGALASAISSILMIALIAGAVYFIYRMVRRKTDTSAPLRPAYAAGAGNGNASFRTPDIGARVEPSRPAAFSGAAPASLAAEEAVIAGPVGVPADFDTEAFLRHAKTNFIRLQAAWDRADINDIREFSTPEMFAELRLQLQERGASANHTDVVSLNATLLGIETVGNDYLAGVKFDGSIRESEGAAPEAFSEIWNLSKPQNGQGGWLLAGIQQVN